VHEDAEEEHPPKAGSSMEESPFPPTDGTLDRALTVVAYLREHCPWDGKQTARTLIPHLLEESAEVVDAILEGDTDTLRAELGDLLLNVAFQFVIAEEAGAFTPEEVVESLEAKMIRRHPHVFGDGEKIPWEVVKARERSEGAARKAPGDRTHPGVLEDLSKGLAPLVRAHRIQQKVAGVGFDWDDARGALAKVREELAEVEEQMLRGERGTDGSPGRDEALHEEIGDLLFSVVNLARLSGIHASISLEDANRKFTHRFRALEGLARERGVEIPGASLAELDELWDEVKRSERNTDSLQ